MNDLGRKYILRSNQQMIDVIPTNLKQKASNLST